MNIGKDVTKPKQTTLTKYGFPKIQTKLKIPKNIVMLDPFKVTTVTDMINPKTLPLRPFDKKDWKRVQQIEDAMKRGEYIRPVTFRKKDSKIVIVDGDHRVQATRNVGVKIPAIDVSSDFNY